MVAALRPANHGTARRLLGNVNPAPLPFPAPPGALEAGKGRGLEGTALQISWVALDFILFLNPKARYLFHCSLGLSPQAKAQERSKIMT